MVSQEDPVTTEEEAWAQTCHVRGSAEDLEPG